MFMILLKIPPAFFFQYNAALFFFLQLFQQRGVLSIVKSSNSLMVSRDRRVVGERGRSEDGEKMSEGRDIKGRWETETGGKMEDG